MNSNDESEVKKKNIKIDRRQKAFADYIFIIKFLKGILRFELLCYLGIALLYDNNFIYKLGIIILPIFLIVIDIIFDNIKKDQKIEFDFDFEREKSIYCHMNSNWKRLKNGGEECVDYSEWKSYVKKRYIGDSEQICDGFKYYLDSRLKHFKEVKHIYEIVFIPLSILALTLVFSFIKIIDNKDLFAACFSTIISIGFLEYHVLVSINSYNINIDFMEEFTGIIYKK